MTRFTATIAAIACCAAVHGTERDTDDAAAKTEVDVVVQCIATYENRTKHRTPNKGETCPLAQCGDVVSKMAKDCLGVVEKLPHGTQPTMYQVRWESGGLAVPTGVLVEGRSILTRRDTLDTKAILADLDEQIATRMAELAKIAAQEAKAAKTAKE